MKYAVLTAAAIFMAASATAHTGHAELAEPSSLPGSATYGLDRAMESISLALTFSKANKAEKRLNIAEERLAEARKLAREDRPEEAEKAVKGYSKQMEKVDGIRKDLPEEKEKELGDHINSTRDMHRAVLKSVMDKVPEQARSGIRTALGSRGPVDIPAPPAGGDNPEAGKDEDVSYQGFVATGKVTPRNQSTTP